MAVLTGIDFFTVELLTWRGLATYYVLSLIQLESRGVALAGLTKHPDALWMEQMARNAVDPDSGYLRTSGTYFTIATPSSAPPFDRSSNLRARNV